MWNGLVSDELNELFQLYSDRFDGTEPDEYEDVNYEDILYPTVAQAIENSSPELGALGSDMVMDRIYKYHCVDCLQWPLLPFSCNGQDLVCHSAHSCI